jgi:outer membrane lipoprotein-sorting protein
MNTHEKINEMLAGYLLGDLSDSQSSEVEAHLTECQDCTGQAQRLRAVLKSTSQMSQLSADERACESARKALFETIGTDQSKQPTSRPTVSLESLWRTIMKGRMTKLAAAAVIIIAVLIGINQFGGSIDGASVAWADVAERFESVSFFNVTIYLGWGPYAQDQKLEFHKIEQWKSENGRTRTHSGNEVIFAEFVDGNSVVVAFDSSTKQPLNADRIAKLANSFHGFLRTKGEFSLDTVLMGFPSDDTGITPVDTADTAASKETVLFELKHKTIPTIQYSIWALRKSKLPVRASFSDTKTKVYADMLYAVQLFGKERR